MEFTVKKFDLAVKSVLPKPLYPVSGDNINLTAKVVNYGSSPASSFSLKFYFQSGNDWQIFSEETGLNLSSYDSTLITSSAKLRLNDTKNIMCRVIFNADEDTLNNFYVAAISPGAKRNDLLITEVMHDPLTGESEWVELINASGNSINLRDWQISDLLSTPTKAAITARDNYLNPGEYCVIAYDTLRYRFFPPKKFFFR